MNNSANFLLKKEGEKDKRRLSLKANEKQEAILSNCFYHKLIHNVGDFQRINKSKKDNTITRLEQHFQVITR